MAKVIQVIEVEITRGKGIEGDVMRGVTQYWSLDGELLAENDPLATDRPTPSIERGAQMLRDLYQHGLAAQSNGHQGGEG